MVSDYPLSCVRELPMLHPAGRRTELLVLLPALEFAVAIWAFEEMGGGYVLLARFCRSTRYNGTFRSCPRLHFPSLFVQPRAILAAIGFGEP